MGDIQQTLGAAREEIAAIMVEALRVHRRKGAEMTHGEAANHFLDMHDDIQKVIDRAIAEADEFSGAKTLIVLVEDKSEYERLAKEAEAAREQTVIAQAVARKKFVSGFKPKEDDDAAAS